MKIKKIRKQVGLSQVQLAEKLKCTQGEISRWENGLEPSIANLIKLSDALGCTIDELVR